MLHIWVRVVKVPFASDNFESEHLKAEDVCVSVCVCVFDTSTFILSLSTGRLDSLSLVHMEDLDLVYTTTRV